MSEKICGIYKITNLVNGKVYIGQSQDIYSRWKEHKYARNKRECFALYGAFKKYGLDNFSFEIVECCPFEQLNEKEIYYIAQYHSYVGDAKSNGYNMTKGGALSFTHVGNDDQGKVVYQYDLKGNFIREWSSTMECGRNGYNQGSVSACCRGKRKYHKDCIWKYKEDY